MPVPAELSRLIELLGTPHVTPELEFVANVAVAVGLALVGGWAAMRLGLPAVVGYVIAGIAIGPFTPGFVGDQARINALAELGIVLLLFALGVEMSIREVRRLGRILAVGSVTQVAGATAAVALLAAVLGFDARSAIVMGMAISICSTLVLVKMLAARAEERSLHGRTASGWGVAQDLMTVIFIVALPSLAGEDPLVPLLVSVVKAVVFLGLSYLAGTRLLPPIFAAVAGIGSSELFLLTVFGTALLAAVTSSIIFGLSLALGAFVAGLVVSESELSHQSAAAVVPFRDLFAVMFFVSVGMLVDPATLAAFLPTILLLLAVAAAAKWLLASGVSYVLGLPARTAILIGGALVNAGEFTLLLGNAAVSAGVLGPAGYAVVLGVAVASILIASPAFSLAHRVAALVDERIARRHLEAAVAGAGSRPSGDGFAAVGAGKGLTDGESEELASGPGVSAALERHVLVLGAGGVGSLVARGLLTRGFTPIVVDRDQRRLAQLASLGAVTIFGDAADPAILRIGLGPTTRLVVVALPDQATIRLAVERLHRLAPDAEVVTRVRGTSMLHELRRLGVHRFVEPETEAGVELTRQALQRLGVSSHELGYIVQGLRRLSYGA